MKSGLRAVAVASLVVVCTMTAGVIALALALAPAAGAASTGNSASSALETWYQRTGHPTLQTFTADIQRFQEVTGSSTPSVARQDCNRFKLDVLGATHKKLPPQATLASDYRYYLLAAASRFKECVSGLGAKNAVQVAEGAQGGALAVQAAIAIIKGTGHGTAVDLAPSSTNIQPSLPASLVVPQCDADFKIVEVATAAYNAQNHAPPVPPSPWSAATYDRNFGPLLSQKGGGPFLAQVPETTHYVIEYDSSGNVWVEPPGQYDSSYNSARGSYTDCAAVAH
jgi:hypothetical protein